MVLGMYPSNSDEAGITDVAKQTKFEVKAIAWGTLDLNLPPAQPAGTSGPCPQKGGEEGAKYIALGTATALAIASSLY